MESLIIYLFYSKSLRKLSICNKIRKLKIRKEKGNTNKYRLVKGS